MTLAELEGKLAAIEDKLDYALGLVSTLLAEEVEQETTE